MPERAFESMANLVIVESPAKASTIKGYLGSNYKVIASKGHVRDLPKSTLGVDIEDGFNAHYINIRGKGDLIKTLKKEAKSANKIFLATDPDREGEAISWHLMTALGIPEDKSCRISFNEVTKSAVKEAVKNPRRIDIDLVNSQQARRILDRIVGYKLSPFLWKSVKSGLSAGRVQSVATKIIVDRENEIEAFIPEEYWTVDATLKNSNGILFEARYFGEGSKKKKITNGTDANNVVFDCEGKDFISQNIKKSKKQKMPAPPFTTSTLLQEASRKLGFQSARIMKVAQELYEGINLGSEHGGVHGLITYMRTDSLRISAEAQSAALGYINDKFGAKYAPVKPNVYKSKDAGAQDAHEAIRPSDVTIEPQKIKKLLSSDQFKLYQLIWERFVASQMAAAVLNTVSVDFSCGKHTFRSTGSTVEFQGYMALYEEGTDEGSKNVFQQDVETLLPPLCDGESVHAEKIGANQHFTEPPSRFNEASFIKFLKEKGIGRPSTYTPIITTILARGYVAREGKSLRPTSLGVVTTKLMNEYFPDIVNYEFTANMEDKLDGIEHGGYSMQSVLGDFYSNFESELEAANEKVKPEEIEIPSEQTDIVCDKCGSIMVVKNGRYGKFAACPNYPECKNTKPLGRDGKVLEKEEKPVVLADFKCELCGADMVVRSGKFGNFYACANYPKCKNTKQITKDTGVLCPECGAKIVTKYGRNRSVFYSCERYPECNFSSWDAPTTEKCEKCGGILFAKKGKNQLVCHNKACGFKKDIEIKEDN